MTTIQGTDGDTTGSVVAALASIPGDSQAIAVYVTPISDVTGTPTLTFDMPTVAGKVFHVWHITMEIATRTGAATGTMTYDIAQNGASIDGAIGPGTYSFSSANINLLPLSDLHNSASIFPIAAMDSFPLQIKIAGAIGGVSVMTARFAIYGRYE